MATPPCTSSFLSSEISLKLITTADLATLLTSTHQQKLEKSSDLSGEQSSSEIPSDTTPQEAARRVLLFDCRPRSFYELNHVQGAVHAPFLVRWKESETPPQSSVSFSSEPPTTSRDTLVLEPSCSSERAASLLKAFEGSASMKYCQAREFRHRQGCVVVVYDSSSTRIDTDSPAVSFARLISKEGMAHSVFLLQGGYSLFSSKHPQLCRRRSQKMSEKSEKTEVVTALDTMPAPPPPPSESALPEIPGTSSDPHPGRTEWGLSCATRNKSIYSL